MFDHLTVKQYNLLKAAIEKDGDTIESFENAYNKLNSYKTIRELVQTMFTYDELISDMKNIKLKMLNDTSVLAQFINSYEGAYVLTDDEYNEYYFYFN